MRFKGLGPAVQEIGFDERIGFELGRRKVTLMSVDDPETRETGRSGNVAVGIRHLADVDAVRSSNADGRRSQLGSHLCLGHARRRRCHRRRRTRILRANYARTTFRRNWIPIHDSLKEKKRENTTVTNTSAPVCLDSSTLFIIVTPLQSKPEFHHDFIQCLHYSSFNYAMNSIMQYQLMVIDRAIIFLLLNRTILTWKTQILTNFDLENPKF